MSEHAAAKLLAEQLSGQHIDRIVRFVTDVGAGRVRATITAELRQIYHVAGFTTLSLTARDSGDLSEFELPAGAGPVSAPQRFRKRPVEPALGLVTRYYPCKPDVFAATYEAVTE